MVGELGGGGTLAHQGEGVGGDRVEAGGAFAIEDCALGRGHGLHDEAVDDAHEEGAEVEGALDVQNVLRYQPAHHTSTQLPSAPTTFTS